MYSNFARRGCTVRSHCRRGAEKVGRLLEGLKERGLFDDTVVVLTADHGQNLGELGMWSMMSASCTTRF